MLLFIKMYKRMNIIKKVYKTYSKTHIVNKTHKITNPWSGKSLNIKELSSNKNYKLIEESILNNYFKL